MAIKLLGADGITQQLLNWIREARDTAVQKAQEAQTAANQAAGSATTASGHATTASQHRADALTARDQAQGWSEAEDVTALPGATPESKSARAWSGESKEFRDQSKTFRDQAETLVGRAAGE